MAGTSALRSCVLVVLENLRFNTQTGVFFGLRNHIHQAALLLRFRCCIRACAANGCPKLSRFYSRCSRAKLAEIWGNRICLRTRAAVLRAPFGYPPLGHLAFRQSFQTRGSRTLMERFPGFLFGSFLFELHRLHLSGLLTIQDPDTCIPARFSAQWRVQCRLFGRGEFPPNNPALPDVTQRRASRLYCNASRKLRASDRHRIDTELGVASNAIRCNRRDREHPPGET